MRKTFLFLIIFIFLISSIFSATRTFNSSGEGEFYIDILNVEGNIPNAKNQKIISYAVKNDESINGLYTYDFITDSTKSQQVIAYPKNKNFVPFPKAIDLGTSDSNNVLFLNYKDSKYSSNLNKCEIYFDETTQQITSNLQPFKVYSKHTGSWELFPLDLSSFSNTADKNYFQNKLNSYYFINTSAKFFLANGSIIKRDIPVGDVPVNLSEIYGGDYLAVEFLPQDLKCDFDESGGLNSSEIQGVFVNNSLANINDYFDNTINFSVSNVRQINILNDTLKVDINYSFDRKNVSVNFSRLKKSGGKNVSVYFLLNKNSWGDLSADDIMDLRADFKTNFPLSNEFDFFVVDKDPIIGYHFDILPENINVGFNGTIDGVLIESDVKLLENIKNQV